jgi:hypothetical protein
MKVEEVSFNTQQDLFAGEGFVGYVVSSMRSDRVFGRLVEILVVCVDDLNPGWLNVRALASEVHRENTKGAGDHEANRRAWRRAAHERLPSREQ